MIGASLVNAPGLEVQLNGLRVDIGRLSKQARFVWNNKVLEEAALVFEEEIKKNINSVTGELEGSVGHIKEPDRVKIFVTAPHAIYLEEGTKPSPGRYVPVLDKRLINREPHKGRAGRKTYKEKNAKRLARMRAISNSSKVEPTKIIDRRNIKKPPGY